MADISPELAGKIRELQGKYEENPGRFFVPLANAYRDAGEIGQAEQLLRTGLKGHPGYLSARIVLGRCLADRGAVDEANTEFRYVLSVDPQNLIALRTLGEMAAAAGNADEAGRWYGELLAVDPMNKEAREALDGLSASSPAASPPADAFPAASAPAPAEPDAQALDAGLDDFSPLDLDIPVVPRPAPRSDAPEADDFGLLEIRDEAFSLAEEQPKAPRTGFLDEGAGTSGLDASASDADVGEFGTIDLEASAAPPATPEPASGDFGGWGAISLDAPEEQPPAAEPEGAAEYDAFSFGDVPLSDDLAEQPADAGSDGWDAGPAPDLDLAPGSFGAEEPAEHDDDGELVTETMAELYARQGFPERAADVYRELIRHRGEEPALVSRLREIEQAMAAPSAGAETASPELESGFAHDDLAHGDEHAEDLPLIETGLPGLNFTDGAADFEREPVGAGVGSESDGSSAQAFDASSSSGDAFADSFVNGFDGLPAFPDAAQSAGSTKSTGDVQPPAAELTPTDPQAGAASDLQAPAEDAFGFDSGTGFPDLGDFASHTDFAASADAQPVAEQAQPEDISADRPHFASAEAEQESEGRSEQPEAVSSQPQQPSAPAPASAPSITAYLAGILSWRPGMQASAAAVEAPASPAQPETPAFGEGTSSSDASTSAGFDTGVADFGADSVPVDAEPEAASAASDDSFAAPYAEDEPAESPDDLPWLSTDASAGEPQAAEDVANFGFDASTGTAEAEQADDEPAVEDLPWMDSAAPAQQDAPDDFAPMDMPWAADPPSAQPADDAAQAEEPAPWETPAPAAAAADDVPPFDDFVLDAPAPEASAQAEAADAYPWEMDAAPDTPAPVEQAPAASDAPAAGGFSFEDFFAAPAAAPAQPSTPVPAPAPVPAPSFDATPAPSSAPAEPAPGGSGDDDEDLESFQAWLQSLKR
jgi:tetratricopeptide (TPR) repeat protein